MDGLVANATHISWLFPELLMLLSVNHDHLTSESSSSFLSNLISANSSQFNMEMLVKKFECVLLPSKEDKQLRRHLKKSILKTKRKNRELMKGSSIHQIMPTIVATLQLQNYSMPSAYSSSEFFEDEFWPLSTRLIMSIIFIGLSTVGIIGNLLIVTVVCKVPRMISPTNCYLTSLAVSDSLFFVAAAPTELTYLHVASSKYIFGQVGCAIFSYLPFLAINTSSLSITAFTIERFIGICYPLRARYICTVKRAKHIIYFIWIFCIIYNSPWLYLATLKRDDHGQVCGFKLERDSWVYKIMFFDDFAAFYLIPMILYIFMYGKIVLTLNRCGFQSPKLFNHEEIILKRCSLNNEKESLTKLTKEDSLTTARVERPINNISNIHRKSSRHGKVQVVKMLALVVIIFAVCWLPYRIMVMYNSFVSNSRWDADWYIFFSKTLIFFNCSINPILYNVMSSRFRRAFHRLIDEHLYWPKKIPAWLHPQKSSSQSSNAKSLCSNKV